MPKENS